MKIILASGSPRRKELMSQFTQKYNLNYEIIASEADEERLKHTIKIPGELVEKLSYIKAQEIFKKVKNEYKDVVVIGADTIVFLNGKVMGKPKNQEDAVNMLCEIQGKVNEVYTGLTIIIKRGSEIKYEICHSVIKVYMKPMTEIDILEYIATKEPMDKAGAYAIQGIGGRYIEKYEGDFNTAVGLNIVELERLFVENKLFN